jgi:uncharacterized protein (DUF4415 family)
MKKKKHTISYTAKELAAMRKRGASRSDWAKSASQSQAQLKASIASDSDEAGMVVDWAKATIDMPRPKATLNMRVDRDVLEFFKRTGRGYQTRINAILRSYFEHRHQSERP